MQVISKAMATAQSAVTFAVCIFMITELILAKKNYYDILRVPKDATERQIKKAFHKLAMKHHPDKNKSPDAEVRFREIAEGIFGIFFFFSCIHFFKIIPSLNFVSLQLMKLYQMKPEEDNMISLVKPRISLGKSKANIDRVPTNRIRSILMTFSRTLTSTARTDTLVTPETLMNTPGHTVDIRGTFKEVLEMIYLMTCWRT